jgi:hypothetical protein
MLIPQREIAVVAGEYGLMATIARWRDRLALAEHRAGEIVEYAGKLRLHEDPDLCGPLRAQ